MNLGERPARRWLVFLTGATVLALFFSTQDYLYYCLTGAHEPWIHALIWSLPDWYLWAVIAFFVLKLSERFRLERGSWVQSLSVHVPASLVLSVLHIVVVVSLVFLLDPKYAAANLWTQKLWYNFTIRFQWNVVTYWAIVGLSHAIAYSIASEERRRRAAQLEGELLLGAVG
jgi:hypothetical protein